MGDDPHITLAMRLDRYFSGVPVRLQSPLSPETLAERINDATTPTMDIMNSDTIVGRAGPTGMRLKYRGGIFGYNLRPILHGSIFPLKNGGSFLALKYGAQGLAIAIFAVWYVGLTLMTLNVLSQGAANVDFVFVALWLGPFILHLIGTRHSDDELETLLSFLREEGEASAR